MDSNSTIANDIEDPELEEEGFEDDEYLEYRAISKMALFAIFFAIIAPAAFLWSQMVILPAASIILGWRALRAIKLHPDEIIGKLPAKIALTASSIVLVAASTWHIFDHYTEVPAGYERMTWKQLKPSEDNSSVPVSETALNSEGEQIFIEGYVYPNDTKTNLSAFVLVRDRGTCCFGGQPDPTDMMYVVLEDPLKINYSLRQRKLGGTFTIDRNAGQSVGKIKSMGFYRLKADYLK